MSGIQWKSKGIEKATLKPQCAFFITCKFWNWNLRPSSYTHSPLATLPPCHHIWFRFFGLKQRRRPWELQTVTVFDTDTVSFGFWYPTQNPCISHTPAPALCQLSVLALCFLLLCINVIPFSFGWTLYIYIHIDIYVLFFMFVSTFCIFFLVMFIASGFKTCMWPY